MKTKTIVSTDEAYGLLESQVATAVAGLSGPLFRTRPERLSDAWLGMLPENRRHYDCHCCRRFIDLAFPLVCIDEHGDMSAPILDVLLGSAPSFFAPAIDKVRSTMISTLLDDIKAGMGFDAIKQRWDAKMHPLRYQRPTAAPTLGNIRAAEEMVEKLGVASAMERRYARLEEVRAYWKPKPVEIPQTPLRREQGVFDHLRPMAARPVGRVELPAEEMGWKRFREEVLPKAARIECQAPWSGAYFGLVTAVHADAKPILQWDQPERGKPNPFSWFFFVHGSPASQWGLDAGWRP